MNIRKLAQRKLLSFLSSKWGMSACVVGLLLLLNTSFYIVRVLLQFDYKVPTTSSTRDWQNNIAGASFQDSLCSPEIDFVYTWVNGTDPRLIEALAQARQKAGLEAEHLCVRDNSTASNSSTNSTSTKKKCMNDVDSLSRFIDNEELRFSLRSVEKFAPWVRNIYIVTNGQIPYWLDLSHPRLQLVTHEMIFPNHTHLPTFSSPAIETHLHRIPGLSKRFLYLNDDTLFGTPVYPDDFFTSGKGQKIYLAWPVPDCNDGCPASWISDGYCDQACNVSACNFDGGDCANASSTRFSANNNWGAWRGEQTTTEYCSWGCPNSWIGDKYCDRPCQNPECGMDGGDCGIETVYSSVYGLNISEDTPARFEVPLNTSAMYIGLRGIIGDARIVDGSHDNSKIVRTATISQKHKTMVLTFHRNITRQEVVISVVAMDGENKIEKNFNMSVATSSAEGGTTSNSSIGDATTSSEGEDEGHAWDSVENAKNADEEDFDELFDINAALLSRDLTENEDFDFYDGELDDAEGIAPPGGARSLLSYQDKSADISLPSFSSSSRQLHHPQRQQKRSHKPIIDPHWERDRKLAHVSRINREMHELSSPPLFPWELGPSTRPSANKDAEETGRRGRRKLLDAFGDSLRFVNRLLDQEFGRDSRRVIAHMPHMINRDVVNDMQARWPEQFHATSSHQFRHPNDMQFAFSHYYFLMSQRVEFDFERVWRNDLDLDNSGYLDENELRTLSARINGVNQRKFEELKERLRDGRCRRGMTEGDHNDTYGGVPPDNSSSTQDTNATEPASPSASAPASPSSSPSGSPANEQAEEPTPSSSFPSLSASSSSRLLAALDRRNAKGGQKNRDQLLNEWRSRFRGHPSGMRGGAGGGAGIFGDPSTFQDQERTLSQESGSNSDSDNVEDSAQNLGENEGDGGVDTVQGEATNATDASNNTLAAEDKVMTEEERKKEEKRKKEEEKKKEELEQKQKKEEEERKRDEAIAREDPIQISMNDLAGCEDVMDKIYDHYSKKLRNKWEIVSTEDDVAFLMVNANATTTRQKLDGIRQKPRKFVCINDDIDHSDPRSVTTLKVIRKFYQSMLPVPSSFELPEGQRNPYLYYEEYEQFLREKKAKVEDGEEGYWGWGLLLLSLVCAMVCLYKLCRGPAAGAAAGRREGDRSRASREASILRFLRRGGGE